MSVRSLSRSAVLAAGLLGAASAFAASAGPCTPGPAAFEGSRTAVQADYALWQRSGMARVSKLAEYEPHDPAVVKARSEYERLRTGDAYREEVARIAAARGETMSGFNDAAGCDTAPAR